MCLPTFLALLAEANPAEQSVTGMPFWMQCVKWVAAGVVGSVPVAIALGFYLKKAWRGLAAVVTLVRRLNAQLSHNGGTSLLDIVHRLDGSVDKLDGRIDKLERRSRRQSKGQKVTHATLAYIGHRQDVQEWHNAREAVHKKRNDLNNSKFMEEAERIADGPRPLPVEQVVDMDYVLPAVKHPPVRNLLDPGAEQ